VLKSKVKKFLFFIISKRKVSHKIKMRKEMKKKLQNKQKLFFSFLIFLISMRAQSEWRRVAEEKI
jgi:hypothetical protein